MPDVDKLVTSIERCIKKGDCQDCAYECGIDHSCISNLLHDALDVIKAQNEVITELRKVGYPHNFQREEPWIVNYMYAITDVIKKAVNLDEPHKRDD